MYFDDEMERRVRRHTFREVDVPVAPREDLVVIKAMMHDEDTPRHWYDALGILANAGSDEIDWEYLLFRARQGSRRVLSLLLYAQSCDLVVPESVVNALYEQITGPVGMGQSQLGVGEISDLG
jgi:hypothetical protein